MHRESELKYAIIIPARFSSSRFPGKPLVDLCGKSMLLRVWERCCEAIDSGDVYVATDDERIMLHCNKLGMQVVSTSTECLTGTDRIYEASKSIDADIYINVQGDEPLIDPIDIQKVISHSMKNPRHIINAMCPIETEEDFRSSTIPKVVARPDGRLLYMSRAAIPTNKKLNFVSAKKQVCIYAFPAECLHEFSKFSQKTPLEEIEDIEILRFMELGFEVNMIEVSKASVAVDVPSDVTRVEAILNEAC